MVSLQVHDYDSQLAWRTIPLIAQRIDEASRLSIAQKTEIFANIKRYLSLEPPFFGVAQAIYDIIVRDYMQWDHTKGNNPNYDSTDDLFADDLLVMMVDIFVPENDETPNRKRLMIMMLEEMAGGLCSQGRCKRLYQLYYTLKAI